jgi:hypothetical protein
MVISRNLTPGQPLLYVSDIFVGFATFLEDKSGWPRVQFSDGSKCIVDPESVYEFSEASFGLLLDRYGTAIKECDALKTERFGDMVDIMADAVGYKDRKRLMGIHAVANQMMEKAA